MEANPALTPELRNDIANIRRNVELESSLISDLLDLTRIEKGKLQLDEQDVDLHLLIRSAVDDASPIRRAISLARTPQNSERATRPPTISDIASEPRTSIRSKAATTAPSGAPSDGEMMANRT